MQILFINSTVNKIIAAFSWMLIHSLWQGLLLALIVSVVLLFTKKWKAVARYNLVLMLFALLVPVAVITFVYEWNNVVAANTSAGFATGLSEKVSRLFFGNMPQLQTILNNCNAWFTAHEQWIVFFWLIIFGIKLIKTTGELYYHRQMKKRLVVMPDPYWKENTKQLCASLQINKAVVLLESIYMKIPVVIGHIKPVILMPAGLLMSLPPEQAEAILLHELAHIKRNDYLVNFLQYAAENIFFFNPAILWVSAWLREERENCCDDIALEQTQNNIGLAEALISFKQHQLYGHAYQTAFPGKKNQLLRRVSRILGKHDKSSSISQRLFFALLFLLLLAAATAAILVRGKDATKTIAAKETIIPVVAIQKQVAAISIEKKTVSKPAQHATVAAISKIISAERSATMARNNPLPQSAIAELPEPITDQKRMAIDDAEQAKKDQIQAMKDQQMAKLDMEQALRDQRQAMIDQQQAAKDQVQAKIDQLQAMQDAANAKEQQENDRREQEMLIKKKEAEKRFKNRISL